MRLADFRTEVLARAVSIYAREAYGEDWPEAVRRAARIRGRTAHQILRMMIDESHQGGDEHHRRYVLRLGNPHYPCMKLALEEFFFDGEFFFLVDTHDELDLDPGFPGYEDWEELRSYNRDLKARIERAWAEAGLPTIEEVRDLAAEDAEHPTHAPRGKKVLLALDYEAESQAVAYALRSQGYEVIETNDPNGLVEHVKRNRPDLVLVAHLLAGQSGRMLAGPLGRFRRRRAGRRPLRVVLGALRWDMRESPKEVDAVIRQPFESSQLFRVLEELLD